MSHTCSSVTCHAYSPATSIPAFVISQSGSKCNTGACAYSLLPEVSNIHHSEHSMLTAQVCLLKAHGCAHHMCSVPFCHGCISCCVQLKYGHYDVRPPNFTCDPSKRYYYWLDLELAGPLGEALRFKLRTWQDYPESPLVNGVYTAASDLYCFGQMLNRWGGSVQSEEGKVFLQLMARPPSQQQYSAEQLLARAGPWFDRVGVHLA